MHLVGCRSPAMTNRAETFVQPPADLSAWWQGYACCATTHEPTKNKPQLLPRLRISAVAFQCFLGLCWLYSYLVRSTPAIERFPTWSPSPVAQASHCASEVQVPLKTTTHVGNPLPPPIRQPLHVRPGGQSWDGRVVSDRNTNITSC